MKYVGLIRLTCVGVSKQRSNYNNKEMNKRVERDIVEMEGAERHRTEQ